jgi:hypothetical protein
MNCNNCGTEMYDLVLSYYRPDPIFPNVVPDIQDEVKISANGEPGAPKYYLYICPNCGNVQAKKGEDN